MVDVGATTGAETIETREALGTDDSAVHQYWMTQDKIAEKEERDWIKRARAIVKRYRDERPYTGGTARFNILWSNVETLKPTLYSRTPKPDVERRFKDADPVGRLAAIVLERCIKYSIDSYDFDDVMKACVEDRLLPGRGVARVFYVPHFGDPIAQDGTNKEFEEDAAAPAIIDNTGDEGAKAPAPELAKAQEAPDATREVLYEEARCKYVYWEDYREGPARTWEEVPWVRYRAYMTRDELIARFGQTGRRVNLDYTPKGAEKDGDDPIADIFKKAEVWEIWDKTRKEAIWIAPGTPDLVLDKLPDPLKLPGFFPNPNPLLATTTTNKRIPVPDYIEYQDQAIELDTITGRIDKLVKALKVAGVYAGDEKSVLQQLLDEGTENRLIPVADWAAFAGDKGGLQNLIQWLPIQQIAAVLIQLYDSRDKIKQTLYELTGLADVIRGASNPAETYGAQAIKSQFATLRIGPQQKDVARFARDLIRLKAAIIAEHFSPQTISMITGYPQLQPVPQLPPPPIPPQMAPQTAQLDPQTGQPVPNPEMQAYQQQMVQWRVMAMQVQAIQAQNQQKQQQFEQAVALIKQDALHDFRVDIEADSTIAADEEQDKESRVELLQQFIPLLEQLIPFVGQNPAFIDLGKEVAMFALRGFRIGRQLEETFENAFEQLKQSPPVPKQGEGGKAAGDEAIAEAQKSDAAVKLQIAQTDASVQQQKILASVQSAREKLESTERIEAARLQIAREKAEDQRRFRAAEMNSIEARSAQGLV